MTKKATPSTIDDWIGADIEIEGAVGVVRRGKLTRVRSRPVTVNGELIGFPVELVLDNEEAEPIPFMSAARIVVTTLPKSGG